MLIIGAKGHAKEIIEIIREKDVYSDLFFFDNISKNDETHLFGYPILKSFVEVNKLFEVDRNFTLGLGMPKIRYKLTQQLLEKGGVFVSLISSKALVAKDIQSGSGINIMPFASIFNDVSLGNGVLVNSFASVHHDSKIGDFTELSPGCRILGRCTIGFMCSIGTNAVILPDIEITDNVIVGAGAIVTKPIYEPGVYVGNPAKKIIQNGR